MEKKDMMNFKKRSLARYGLAMLVLAGGTLLVGTSSSGAADQSAKQDFDCWLNFDRICNLTYFPQCWQQPDGTSCYRCPYTFYGAANCVRRPGYVCQPSEDLPFDCGPKHFGLCVGGVCFGEIVSLELCKILQCTDVSS